MDIINVPANLDAYGFLEEPQIDRPVDVLAIVQKVNDGRTGNQYMTRYTTVQEFLAMVPPGTDVLWFPNMAAFPVTGQTNIIYVDKGTGLQYFWDGATYIELSPPDGTGRFELGVGANSAKQKGTASAANGFNSLAGADGSANGENAVAFGQGSTADGNNSTAASGAVVQSSAINGWGCGTGTVVRGPNSSALSGGQTGVSANNAFATGSGSQANGSNSHAEGLSNTANAPNSHVEGSFNSAGLDSSHVEGIFNTVAAGFSPFGSHVEGDSNTVLAFSESCHVEGTGNIASNEQAHAEGYYTEAAGKASHSAGQYNSAIAGNSYAGGRNSYSGRYSEFSRGAEGDATNYLSRGRSQFSTIPLATFAYSATPLELTSYSGAGVVTIYNSSTVSFEIHAIGYNQAGNTTIVVKQSGIIKRVGGTVSFEGTPGTVLSGDPTMVANFVDGLVANDVDKKLEIKYNVTGQSVRWVAELKLVQLGFGAFNNS